MALETRSPGLLPPPFACGGKPGRGRCRRRGFVTDPFDIIPHDRSWGLPSRLAAALPRLIFASIVEPAYGSEAIRITKVFHALYSIRPRSGHRFLVKFDAAIRFIAPLLGPLLSEPRFAKQCRGDGVKRGLSGFLYSPLWGRCLDQGSLD